MPDHEHPTPEQVRSMLHEAEVYRIELEVQNEELAAAHARVARDQARMYDLFHQAPVGYVTLDRRGLIREANQAFTDLIGMPLQRIADRPFHPWLAPADRPTFLARFRAMLAHPRAKQLDAHLVDASGAQIPVWITTRPRVPDADDAEPELLLTIADTRPQREAEARARHEELRARSYFEAAGMLFVELDHEQRVTAANPAAATLLHADGERVVGRSWLVGVHPDDRGALDTAARAALQAPTSARPTSAECRVGGPTERVIQWRLSRLGDGLLCSGLDVTEERTLQAQLAHADRLTSLGSIAAGVAHELNNPLTAILGHLEMAVKEAERLGVEELVDMLSDCLEPARRMQATAGRLSSLAGTGDHALRPVDPAEVVRAAARLAANELSPRARVSLQLGATRLVRGHAARLTQVLLNLLTNAAHAVDRAPSGSHEILIGLTEDGDDVEIRVVDSGAGVAPPDRDRIFEPFVTTKNPTHSSGLGLSLARTIVREHGGTLELAPPRADRGACFVVRLPALPPAEPATTRQPPTASRRILVVDDEPVLRKLLRRMLRPHEVVEARDGLGARRLLEHDTFDLVICDVMMPGMSGPELHVWCAEHDPDQALRWLFLTGGAFTPSTRSYLHGCEVPCIDKPFSAAELVAAVQARMVESRTTP